MATSSISIDVRAANSRLAEFLRAKEEEEALLQIGSVRIRKDKPIEEGAAARGKRRKGAFGEPPKKQRWSGSIDFRKASPMAERPRNEAGSSSFHFAVSTVSKEGFPTRNGKPMEGYGRRSRAPGADHELYVSREGAAEIQAAVHAAYVEREGAPEIDSTRAAETDRPNLDEGLAGARIAADARGRPSIFSNISNDRYEREAYWRAVEECERSPRVHTISIDVARDIDWGSRAVNNPNLPGSFRAELELGMADYQAWLLSDRSKDLRPRQWTGDSDACGKVLTTAQEASSFQSRTPALQFRSGRGGTVQHRFVIELPHELTAAERASLTEKFCAHLGALEEGENGITRGMMYTAVIHAPDAHNDARNYHLHIIAHDRPARFLEQYGQWDFEIQEAFEHRWQIRVRHPFRQNKLTIASQWIGKSGSTESGKNFIPVLRRKFAELANEALAAAGLEKRYDHRSYKAMGIDRTPTEHLGTRAAALEAAGVETTIGSLNAAIIWSDAQRQVRQQSQSRKKAAETRHKMLRTFLEEAREQLGPLSAVAALTHAIAERDRLAIDTIEDRELIDEFRLMEAKAKSRAMKVRDTCIQTMADIDAGQANGLEAKQRAKVAARYHEANAWLGRIDQALDGDRPKIEAAERDVRRREERMVELDAEISTLTSQLQPMMKQRAPEREHGTASAQDGKDRGQQRDDSAVMSASQAATQTPQAARDAGGTGSGNSATGQPPAQDKSVRKGANLEPPLFDMPVQNAPTKPGTVADRDARWEALFARISAEKIPVLADPATGRLGIACAREEDNELLCDPAIDRRSQARLSAIQQNQGMAIGRVTAWIDKHGTDPAQVKLAGGGLDLVGAPASVANLLRQWGHHPLLKKAVTEAATRHRDVDHLVAWFGSEARRDDRFWIEGNKLEFASANVRERNLFIRLRHDPRVSAAARAELDRRYELELERQSAARRRQAELARRRDGLIHPGLASGWRPMSLANIRSETLRDFVMELNSGASPESLYHHAVEIQRSRGAVQELHAHGEQLALAYRRAMGATAPQGSCGRDVTR